ncbi:MAG TPA: GDSL-type esterase/lipase family protein [Thermoleophilaceae bacterium]
MRDDGSLGRFDAAGERTFTARDAVVAVFVAVVLLVLFAGGSVKRAGAEMGGGVGKTLVDAVGKPTSRVAAALPFASIGHRLTGWLSPEEDLGSSGSGFASLTTTGVPGGGVPPVTPEAFDPSAVGAAAAPKKPLKTLLVTGDSLSQPLDQELARRLAGSVKVVRDPHVGTGISKSIIVDWGKLSASQVAKDHPSAVVVFIGANEGFPMKGAGGRQIQCCGVDYAALYASRVRQMMNTYRQAGAARVYWLTLPTPRDPDRQKVARTVNAAITVAAEPWRSQVRVFDTVAIFTPGAKYRDAMDVGGQQKIVRESDGIHLNAAGSSLLADRLLPAIDRDFTR